MKIGISVTSAFNIRGEAKNRDGIGVYTAQLCQALTQQNVQIREIYFKTISESCQRNSTATQFSTAASPLCSLLLGNFYKNIQNTVDLLHITDYLAPRIKKTPIIATVHDAIMLKHPQWMDRLNFLKIMVIKRLLKHADHFITVSNAMIPDIAHYWGIPEDKISVVYHGISDSWRRQIDLESQQAILDKYRITKPFFLMVGTLQPRKNTDRTIDAYLSLPKNITENFNLVLAGKAHPTFTPRPLLEKIHHLENQGKLVWLKYLPLADLQSLYQSAYALLFPSLAEGFGFPILEGFAAKTPVITSHLGSMAEIAGPAAYLVDPFAQDSIRAAMLNLLEKPDLRTQLIQQGALRVNTFSWETCAQNTIEIYKKFL